MAEVTVTRTVSAPLEEVWARIGTFSDPSWLPGVTLKEMQGQTRILSVRPSATIRETLVDSADHSLTWLTEETPLPIRDYRVTLAVTAVDAGTEVSWHATFTPTVQAEGQAEAMMRDMVKDMLSAV